MTNKIKKKKNSLGNLSLHTVLQSTLENMSMCVPANQYYLPHTHSSDSVVCMDVWCAPTCGDDGLQLGAVDEGPLDGLGFDVSPVDPLLQRVVVHHRDIVDVWHRQRRHDVHVRVVDVHTADFRPPHIQEEPFQRW